MLYYFHLPSLDDSIDGAGLGLSHPDRGEGLGLSHPPSLTSSPSFRGPLDMGVGVAVVACNRRKDEIVTAVTNEFL